MVLDLINKTIGGDDFISLPVALSLPFSEVRANLQDPIIDKSVHKIIDWYANKHSRTGRDLMYVRIRQDLNPAATLFELHSKETGRILFRYSIQKNFYSIKL